MEHQTLASAAISIPPAQSPSPVHGDKSPPSTYPCPHALPASPSASSGTCPFAEIIPSSRQPRQHVQSDGTVVLQPPQCPRWVRVLRFSAKFIAKQVIMRSAKLALVRLFRRKRDDDSCSDSLSTASSSSQQ